MEDRNSGITGIRKESNRKPRSVEITPNRYAPGWPSQLFGMKDTVRCGIFHRKQGLLCLFHQRTSIYQVFTINTKLSMLTLEVFTEAKNKNYIHWDLA